MKQRLWTIIIFALLCGLRAHPQSAPISGQVFNIYGSPVAGAQVYICSAAGSSGLPCSPPASVFYDYDLNSPAPNPISTDANGNFNVYVGALPFPNTYVVNEVSGYGTPYTLLFAGPSCPLGGCTFSGNITAPTFNATSSPYYEINGVQIASTNLLDSANLARLNTANVFTGTPQTAPVWNATTSFDVNGTPLASTNLSDGANLAKLNASNTFTGATNTFSGIVGTIINAITGFEANGNGGTLGECLTSNGTVFNTPLYCATPFNVLSYGAACNSNGTTGNGTDDRTAIQSALTAIASNSGGVLIIPAGRICRVSNYLSYTGSNLEITGGGNLFGDPPIVSSQPTFDTAVTGIPASLLQIYTSGCTLSAASNPDDITTGRSTSSVISNIDIHDLILSSVGSYSGTLWNSMGGSSSNIPLSDGGVAVWCANNVQVHDTTFAGFYTDGIEAYGVLNYKVTNNNFHGGAFNAAGSFLTSDQVLSGNTAVGQGQGFELTALRVTVSGNTLSKIAMNGIFVEGGPNADTNISGEVSGNTLSRDPSLTAGGYNGIEMGCNGASSSCVESLDIGPNIVNGSWSNGVFGVVGQALAIHDTTSLLTATSGGTAGIQVVTFSGWSTPNPFTLKNNHLTFTTTAYQHGVLAINASSAQLQYILKNNVLIAPSFVGSPTNGYDLFTTATIACVSGNLSSLGNLTDSGCGSAAPTSGAGSVAAGSTNTGGEITGLSSSSSVTLTFAGGGFTNAVFCSANTITSAVAVQVSPVSTTGVSFSFASPYTGSLSYLCSD